MRYVIASSALGASSVSSLTNTLFDVAFRTPLHERANAFETSDLLPSILSSDWTSLGSFWHVLYCAQRDSEVVRSDWQGDALAFRNWVVNHVEAGKVCPLADSVHFLARQKSSESCSFPKAMAYLAVAHGYNDTEESATMVRMAQAHVTSCKFSSFLEFVTKGFDLWTLLLRVLQSIQLAPTEKCNSQSPPLSTVTPSSASGYDPSASTLTSQRTSLTRPAHIPQAQLHFPHEQKQQPRPRATHVDSISASPTKVTPQAPSSPSALREGSASTFFAQQATTIDLQPFAHLFIKDLEGAFFGQYIDVLAPHVGGFIHQLFIDDVPALKGMINSPSWDIVREFNRERLVIHDPHFPSGYSFTLEPLRAVIVLEAEQDTYNKQWIRAYEKALKSLGLIPQYVRSPSEIVGSPTVFWRVNQMFHGGQFAGSHAVGAKIGEFMAAFGPDNRVWPPPSSMKIYQNKVVQLEEFHLNSIPTPGTAVVMRDNIMVATELPNNLFPVLLKHPYAASSRGLELCEESNMIIQCLQGWFQRNEGVQKVLVQQRIDIAEDLRVTYVGEKIIHGYWRRKANHDDISSGTVFSNSTLDFNIPRHKIAPLMKKLAKLSPIGAADICFGKSSDPEELGEAFVLEVSPIFDMNPPAPQEYLYLPYAEYKTTAHYITARETLYEQCARAVIQHSRDAYRHRLVVDIDNTISMSYVRLQSSRPYDENAILEDPPMDKAAETLTILSAHYAIVYLTARAAWGLPKAMRITTKWLSKNYFPDAPILIVDKPFEKLAFLDSQRDILIDDLTTNHHLGTADVMTDMVAELDRRRALFHRFNPWGGDTWESLGTKLLQLAQRKE